MVLILEFLSYIIFINSHNDIVFEIFFADAEAEKAIAAASKTAEASSRQYRRWSCKKN